MSSGRSPSSLDRFFTLLGKVVLMIIALLVGLVGLVLTVCGGLLFSSQLARGVGPALFLVGAGTIVGAIVLMRWLLRDV